MAELGGKRWDPPASGEAQPSGNAGAAAPRTKTKTKAGKATKWGAESVENGPGLLRNERFVLNPF